MPSVRRQHPATEASDLCRWLPLHSSLTQLCCVGVAADLLPLLPLYQ